MKIFLVQTLYLLVTLLVSGRKLEVSGKVSELGKYRGFLPFAFQSHRRLCTVELLVCYMRVSVPEIRLYF